MGRFAGPDCLGRFAKRGRLRHFARGVALALLLPVALVLAASCSGGGGDPDDGTGPEPGDTGLAFSGEAARGLVERQVAFGPRVPNTPPHAAALMFFRDYLSQRADAVRVESFQYVPVQGDTLELANLIAAFAPAAPNRVLLAAHWDSRPVAERDPDPMRRSLPIPGANDGASGVAVLLRVADILSRNPLPAGFGVDLVLLDGEDWGHDPLTLAIRPADMFLGAREFARRHPDYRPVLGILLDLVGDADPVFKHEGHSLDFAPALAGLVWEAAGDLGHGAIFRACRGGRIEDDHVFLNEAGIATIAVIDLDYPAWHTQGDVPAAVSAGTLAIVGEVVVEILYRRLPLFEGPPTTSPLAGRAGSASSALAGAPPAAPIPRLQGPEPCK